MEIEAKHALSTIHSSMNTFPEINRLPPEILALIPFFLNEHKDLVFTTHVCRHWRNTIVASPPLWSSLDNETIHKDLVAAYVTVRLWVSPLRRGSSEGLPAALTRRRDFNVLPIFGCILVESTRRLSVDVQHALDHRR